MRFVIAVYEFNILPPNVVDCCLSKVLQQIKHALNKWMYQIVSDEVVAVTERNVLLRKRMC